jgi:hypothetical protein
MRLIYLLVLLFVSIDVSAQVCSTSKNRDNEITRYARIQFGKDTVVIGVPFKPKDKPGMSFAFSSTKNKTYFSFDLRSVNELLFSDSLKVDDSYLLLTMSNNDTIKITPLKNFGPNNGRFKSPEAISTFLNNYLNLEQIITLAKHKLVNVKYYYKNNTYLDLPITRREKDKFKYAVNYLLQ